MKFNLTAMLIIVSACSQMSKQAQPKIVPVNISDADLQQCITYQKNVLDRAYSTPKGLKDGQPEFTKDIKAARKFLGQFDVSAGLSKPKVQLVSNIINQCDPVAIKEFDNQYKSLGKCSLMFSELNYMQSLAAALNTYKWPTDLKLEGKKVAVDYVKYFSDGTFPLLNRLVALSVLDELSVNQVVNKELHNEIKTVMQESRSYVESLRQKLNKDTGLSCEGLDIIRDELAYSDVVGKKMINFLKRI